MGIFDSLFGRKEAPGPESSPQPNTFGTAADEQAIARYRYMLKTAPPETIEQAHVEAFGRLTPEQRRLVLEQLGAELPRDEQPVMARDASPQSLARLATRAEVRQPGTMERMWGRMPGGPGMGGLMAGSFLSSMAGVVLGTMIAQSFLGDSGFGGTAGDSPPEPQDHTTHAMDDGGDSFDSGGGFDT